MRYTGDTYDDWIERVIDDIPKDVRTRIEQEINSYLEKHPTYYPDEMDGKLNGYLYNKKRRRGTGEIEQGISKKEAAG